MTELQRRLYRELYRKSFYEFVKAFWNTAEPAKFVDGKLIQCYCEIFQYMCKDWVGYDKVDIKVPKKTDDNEIIDVRQDKHNLCLMVPPRHTKSLIFNVFGPVWLWLSNPIKAVSISHTGALAGKMNVGRYNVINSDKFKFFFPEIVITTNTKSAIADNRGGELYSQNRDAMTGYGGDIIINDDLTNAETARRDQAEMAAAWAYYQNTMPSRINDINRCIIMNIQQRLAPNDIAGHIMSEPKLADSYVFVTLPAIFKKDTYVVCPISGTVIEFKKGDFLWPERFGDYSAIRYQVGEAIFETQYLQNPIASDRTVLKPNELTCKDLPDTPGIENAEIVYASHDFPVKDKDTSDYLGSMLAYRCGATLYVVDSLEKRMAFVKSVNYVRALNDKFPGIIQVIEDKANGSPILQQLQDEVPGMQSFNPGTASKMQRLESASLYIDSSNVVLVKTQFNKLTQQWEFTDAMKNLYTRLLAFPFVEHDDIIDAFSMLVLFVFMDRRYMVYGRAFDERNMVDVSTISGIDYSTVFFNKEGDIWKALEIAIQYAESSKLVVKREISFKCGVDEGMQKLRKFAPSKTVFIDCSATEALRGMVTKDVTVERYEIEDYDKSVANTNLAFGKKLILLDNSCVLTRADIENFKFSKSKDETMKYASTKDGFVACIRLALKYYGGIV